MLSRFANPLLHQQLHVPFKSLGCASKTRPLFNVRQFGTSWLRRDAAIRHDQSFMDAFSVKMRDVPMRTFREKFFGPPGSSKFVQGTWALIGASLVGLGGILAYGRSVASSHPNVSWDASFKDRVRQTHIYLMLGAGVTGGAALMAARSTAILSMANWGYLPLMAAAMAAIVATGALTRSIPFENTAMKHSAWAVHYAAMGVFLPPLCLLAGPPLLRTLLYLGGILAGASVTGMAAYSKKSLESTQPIGMALGLAAAVNAASLYLPKGTALAGFPAAVVYGFLALFSMYAIYNTQRIVQAAELIPVDGAGNRQSTGLDKYGQKMMISSGSGGFDPINAQMSLFMDLNNYVLNFFTKGRDIMPAEDQFKTDNKKIPDSTRTSTTRI